MEPPRADMLGNLRRVDPPHSLYLASFTSGDWLGSSYWSIILKSICSYTRMVFYVMQAVLSTHLAFMHLFCYRLMLFLSASHGTISHWRCSVLTDYNFNPIRSHWYFRYKVIHQRCSYRWRTLQDAPLAYHGYRAESRRASNCAIATMLGFLELSYYAGDISHTSEYRQCMDGATSCVGGQVV